MPAVGSQMFSDVSLELGRYAETGDGGNYLNMDNVVDKQCHENGNVGCDKNNKESNGRGSRCMDLIASTPGGQTPPQYLSSDTMLNLLDKIHASQCIWFQPEIDRQTAETLLQDADIGLFIVRASSLPRTLALSLKIPLHYFHLTTKSNSNQATTSETDRMRHERVEHYLIESNGPQLALEGSDASFSTLAALVHHYAQNRNELPVTLRLPEAIDQCLSHRQLLSVLRKTDPFDFWKSPSSTVNIDISSPISAVFSSASLSMLLDSAPEAAAAHSQSPPITVQFSNRNLNRSSRLSPESSSGNLPANVTANLVGGQPDSRLSSKASDYEDVWSLTGTKSPDYAMSDLDHSLTDNETASTKAVGLALRDLDALGDWIENELHYTSSDIYRKPDNNMIASESVPPLKEEMRVIRRGKRRFVGAVVSSRNRFSAPNLSVTNVDDLVPEALAESPVNDDTTSARTGSLYSSVHDLSESQLEPIEAVLPSVEFPDRDADDFVAYTPTRKCMPSRDQNIIESFQSKVVALKRIGSKLLARKGSNNGTNTMPKTFSSKETPHLQERVMVFRSKKPTYDSCWPVDNSNWSVNRITPTTSDISSGTSSSATSADISGRHLTIRSSKSPAGSLPKRSRTFSEFTDATRDLEKEISLERTVNYIVKNTRADFGLSLQITTFMQKFAVTPAENPDEMFGDLRTYCGAIENYILREHRRTLEDFMARDFMGEVNAKRSVLDLYVNAAVQRLVVEPLCPKLIWNIQAKLGSAGDLARLEKGCQVLEVMELTADDVAPEIHFAVIEKLSAIITHFKNFAEAQNILTKGRQLLTVFSDIFGIEASPLDCSFEDLISAFAVAIVKAKAFNIEIHLEFIWQLQPSEFKSASCFPVLLAASCATSVLKSLANDSKLSLADAVDRCLVPAGVSVISLTNDCPVVTQNIQVPLDKRLLGHHLAQLVSVTCDLPVDALVTLQVTTGCLGIVVNKDTFVVPAFDRWRALYPDCVLSLLVQTKSVDGE